MTSSIAQNQIIFAVPRYDYTSYRDLYTLIALSEFPTCFIDEIDPQSNNAYILTIFNGEVPAGGYPDARATIVLYDNEWHLGANALPPLANVRLWVGDKWYAEQIGAQYVPMGSHEGLLEQGRHQAIYESEQWADGGDVYDVAYIGYINGIPRREHIRQQLIERGMRVSPPVAWGGARHHLLSTSRAYLNVHQRDDAPVICPLRMVVAAAYSLPVITEQVASSGVFEPCIDQTQYHWLAETIPYLIRDRFSNLTEVGDALHQLLCHDLTFRMSVEAAL